MIEQNVFYCAAEGAHVKFAITHPMISYPYDPELVSGAGITTVAAAAEAAGFHGFGFTDHPAPPQRWLESGGHDALDPFVAMGFAAATTTTLRLIPNIVVLPYRNPFIVAKAGATLDLLSGGRFTLAVGTGYLKREFAALGVEYDERNEIFDEALEVLHAIWTSDDVSYEGRRFNARGITSHPRPPTAPRPPIWIGGNTARARQRVAKYGDGWCPFPAPASMAPYVGTIAMDTPEKLAQGIADLRQRCENEGRDPASLDIAFSNSAGGALGRDDFSGDAHLERLHELASLGVTWTQVSMPGNSVAHVLEAIAQYRETVITRV